MNLDFDWPAHAIERLRALWADGLSASEIGRQIGTSKNSVVGKAHRIGLPARPSPLHLRGAAHPHWKPRARHSPRSLREPGAVVAIREKRTLAPLGSIMAAALLGPDQREPIDPAVRRELDAARRAVPRPGLTPGAHVGAVRACQFPLGDPRKPGFRFCGEPVERDESGVPTGSYCRSHRCVCYVPTRRQECAA